MIIPTTIPRVKALISMDSLRLYLRLRGVQLCFFMLVLTIPQELIHLSNNGSRLLPSWKNEVYSPSWIQPIKDTLVEMLILMPIQYDCLLTKDSKWLSLNHMPRIWDYMERGVEPWTSWPPTKTSVRRCWVRSRLLFVPCTLVLPFTPQDLLVRSLMTPRCVNSGWLSWRV